MYRVTFVTDLFNGRKDRVESNAVLGIFLNALVQMDIEYLRLHPEAPGIYDSGVIYQQEPMGQDDWNDIPTCLRLRNGDCEDLACWRVAEVYTRYGIHAHPVYSFRTTPNGLVVYHIRVAYPNGHIEDPSRILGMK